jgi:transposase
MTATRSRKRTRSRFVDVLQKPKGVIHPRVQKVGPEHFGIVSIDCAKARCKWMLCDFYGNVLIPPTVVALNRNDIHAAIERLREALARHGIKDQLVAIERTGRYHHFIRDAFAAASYEVRLVHPFATSRFRQPNDPGIKTDDVDMAAIHCATANGFALTEPPLAESWMILQLRVRQRRDLVCKSSQLCCQIREHLDACLPGLAASFEDQLWDSPVAWAIIHQFASPQAVQQAGLDGLQGCLRQAGLRYQQRTLHKVLAWAAAAAAPEKAGLIHHAIARALNEDRTRKAQEIQALESELAGRLTHTPYIRLLSVPGINIISTADLAGEMGPIEHYLNARAITGRAGLRPSRRQSDEVDYPNGRLVRCANRRLRAALMWIADNLVVCNQYFRALAGRWKVAGKDPRHTRVKVASRFTRIAYQIVAGNQVCRHPSMQQPSYILEKLLKFHAEHGTPTAQALADLQAAADQLPKSAHASEALPLAELLRKLEHGRKRGPTAIGDIIPIVLARLGARVLQSTTSGEADSR